MARLWTEPLDLARHRDLMSTNHIGGIECTIPLDRLIEQKVYFIEAAGFTFQFTSLAQIQEALEFFEKRIHPSSRQADIVLEHYWQRWYERLPQWLFKEPRRLKVVAAMTRALTEFRE